VQLRAASTDGVIQKQYFKTRGKGTEGRAKNPPHLVNKPTSSQGVKIGNSRGEKKEGEPGGKKISKEA